MVDVYFGCLGCAPFLLSPVSTTSTRSYRVLAAEMKDSVDSGM